MLETKQLILRRFTLDDAAAVFLLGSIPEIIRYTGDTPMQTEDEARALLQARQLRDYQVHGFGRMACVEKSSGRVIGFSGLKFLEDINEIDVGYRFLPDCWGKGYATESASALVAHESKQHGLRRIIGLVEPANLPSVRVLKKLGLQYERQIRFDNEDHDVDLYAMSLAGQA